MANELTYDNEPACRDEQRRADIVSHPELNGIDYAEYVYRELDPQPHVLVVSFLKPLPDAPHSDPDGAYGLTLHPERIRVDGGARIVGIKVLDVVLVAPHLEIVVDKPGDFSTYWLSVGWVREPDGSWTHVVPLLDRQFSRASIDFKAECPTEFDCREEQICPPELGEAPLLDYLAKDYASFRQLMLDLVAQRNPDWLERNPADLGIALVELMAYAGDHLSYYQDTVANEAYLDTARQRISAKRHARLIDYAMHDGRNAWTYVHIEAGSTGTLPQGTKIVSRIADPLQNDMTPPATVIAEADLPVDAFEGDPALLRSRVFETAFPLEVHPDSNTLYLHAWGNKACCLPRGATVVYLYAPDSDDPQQVVRPPLQAGDYILFEEVMGPETGSAPDADPEHRQAARLLAVEEVEDSVYRDVLSIEGELQVRENAAQAPMPLLRVSWDSEDALGFPLCISATTRTDELLTDVSVAWGNIVLVDHGRTVVESFPQSEPVHQDSGLRLRLGQCPLTQQSQPDALNYEIDPSLGAISITPRLDLRSDARQARPAIALTATSPIGEDIWKPVPHLLDSSGFARHFVVDVDQVGVGEIRFGDGQYGREPGGVNDFKVTYRVGNGRDGNLGSEALAHALRPEVAPAWPTITAIRNPLPADDGEDAETIEGVRQRAPAAFQAEQFRAVTEADYVAAALKLPDVAGAVAAFRWSGSWYTVLVAIDPRNPSDLITEPGRRTRLEPAFARRVLDFLTRYRLAGYDLVVRSGEYVPLEIEIDVCVLPDHFVGDVLQAVHEALSNKVNADGSIGFFHPDKLGFGEPLYLSRLYAAVEAVEGVDSAVVRRFRLFGEEDNGELEAGVIPIGAWQIARLDNDPNFQENGVLRFTAGGGK